MTNYKKIISELLNQSSFYHNKRKSVLNLLGNKKIILYGAGDGLITFSVFILNRYKIKVEAILDKKFKKNQFFRGLPSYSPKNFKPTAAQKKNTVVVITIGKKKYHQEIFTQLRKLGFKNIILATGIYEYHLLHPSKELNKQGNKYYLKNKKQIINALQLFNDELSCKVYTKVLQTHLFKTPISIPNSPLTNQYFPKDIKLKKGYKNFISCGAYNGDTVRQLYKKVGKVKSIACFEPEPENFSLLTKYLRANKKKLADSVIAFPCAVYSHETKLKFSNDYKINSMIDDHGKTVIQGVALDNVIPTFKPTFITMDVEGAEPAALKGAQGLIKENKPNLAICVYHAPNHLWEIPLYLDSLKLGYKFYFRNYTSFISETVLYAVV